LELKGKSAFHGTNHESVIKQDGTVTYELKVDLEKQTNVKGLNLALNFNGNAQPSDKDNETKVGIDFSNNKTKFKWQINPRNYLNETTLMYKHNTRWLFGFNF